MEKIPFQPNDIVKLSKIKFERLSKELFFPQNLFIIKEVNKNEVGIALKNVNHFFSFEDILPVKIDGKEDRDIYYDPIVAASIVTEGEETPAVQRDSSEYYMVSLKKSYDENLESYYVITAKPKAHAFKNEMCFPLTKTKCELKKHPNSKFECFFNDFNRTKTSLFLPFPSKLIQDNLVCVLELQE